MFALKKYLTGGAFFSMHIKSKMWERNSEGERKCACVCENEREEK